jgi:hypothetical protein
MAPAGIAPWQRWDFDLETTEHFLRRMTPIGACLSGVDDDVRNDRRNCCSALRTVIAGTQPVHPKGPSTGVTRLDRFPRNPDARGHTADAPPHSLTGLSPASANDALTAGLVRVGTAAALGTIRSWRPCRLSIGRIANHGRSHVWLSEA